MENESFNDAIQKSGDAAWALGGCGIVYMVASLWMVDMIYKIYVGR